jgi:GNAT superfamily N-acetyltransferase
MTMAPRYQPPVASLAPLKVEPIAGRQARHRFMTFPWQVYAGNPSWVPPLLLDRRRTFDPAVNPFFRHAEVQLFMARRGAQPVGTIAAFVNHAYNRSQAQPVGFFGFFEVLPDPAAASALLATAEAWVAARGLSSIRGPINFATDNESGLLLDAFDQPPVLMTVYNPPYYREYIERAGYVKAMDWYAYMLDRATLGGGNQRDLPPKLLRTVELARRRCGANLRTVRMREFTAELNRVRVVYNRAWEHNYSFVPMDDAEIDFIAASLKAIIDPDLVLIAEVGDQPVGVSITLPDFNQVLRKINGRLLPTGWWQLLRGRARIDTARVFAMGVVPEFRRRGLDALFYYETFLAGVRKGYQRAELSLIVENNLPMRNAVESLGAWINKTYRIYQKALAPA